MDSISRGGGRRGRALRAVFDGDPSPQTWPSFAARLVCPQRGTTAWSCRAGCGSPLLNSGSWEERTKWAEASCGRLPKLEKGTWL